MNARSDTYDLNPPIAKGRAAWVTEVSARQRNEGRARQTHTYGLQPKISVHALPSDLDSGPEKWMEPPILVELVSRARPLC